MNRLLAAALAAFAIGATLLQFCARLPPAPGALVLVAACATVATLRSLLRVRDGSGLIERCMRALAAAAAAGLLGFFYAAWRADTRLADALPPAWETRDVRITGVV